MALLKEHFRFGVFPGIPLYLVLFALALRFGLSTGFSVTVDAFAVGLLALLAGSVLPDLDSPRSPVHDTFQYQKLRNSDAGRDAQVSGNVRINSSRGRLLKDYFTIFLVSWRNSSFVYPRRDSFSPSPLSMDLPRNLGKIQRCAGDHR